MLLLIQFFFLNDIHLHASQDTTSVYCQNNLFVCDAKAPCYPLELHIWSFVCFTVYLTVKDDLGKVKGQACFTTRKILNLSCDLIV